MAWSVQNADPQIRQAHCSSVSNKINQGIVEHSK